jgi:hypothetical protein
MWFSLEVEVVVSVVNGGHLGWAAELIIEGNLSLVPPPISHRKIVSINPDTCPLIDGNQIQDGGYCGHLEWVAELIIERYLPLVTPNRHRKIGSIDLGVCPVIDGNQIQHGGHLTWAAELIIERNLPLVIPNQWSTEKSDQSTQAFVL